MAKVFRELTTKETEAIASLFEMGWFLIVTAGQAIRNDRDDLKQIAKEAKAVRNVVMEYLDDAMVEG